MNDFQEELLTFLNKNQIIAGNQSEAKFFLQEKRKNFTSQCRYILLPNNVKEVSNIIKLCNKYKIAVIPQSGNTGLVGGSVSYENQIILSSINLNKIYTIDNKYSIKAESGVILGDIKRALQPHNLIFPLSLPSEEQCRLGGNIASNAGGISVLKYGTIKDNILGMEVVLPNGDIYSDLNILRKRNIGFDFKNIFVGSEGLLGFITSATFKVYSQPKCYFNLLFATEDVFLLQDIFTNLYDEFANYIGAFEIMQRSAVDVALKHNPKVFFPLDRQFSWYALASFEILSANKSLQQEIITAINKVISSYKVSYYGSENNDIWEVRYKIPDAQRSEGESLKHDIAVPLGKMASFLNSTLPFFKTKENLYRPVIFGHMGDGNLHFNIAKGDEMQESLKLHQAYLKEFIVNEVMKIDGTFSAEHGIGLIHKQEFEKFYGNNQAKQLKWLKYKLDKNNIFNPNKIITTTIG